MNNETIDNLRVQNTCGNPQNNSFGLFEELDIESCSFCLEA